MHLKRTHFLILSVIFLAFLLRFYRLPEIPSGFYQNEASFGYNAFSILKTGRDEYGKFLPLILESFGDFKLAGYTYLLIPFIAVLGLTETSVRLSNVVLSLSSIVIFYFTSLLAFKSRKLALLSSFILAILPWHIVFSRTGNETVAALVFFWLSVFLFLLGRGRSLLVFYILSLISLSLAFLSHYSAWPPGIFLLGVFIFTLLRSEKLLSDKIKVMPLVLFSLIPLLVIFSSLGLSSSGRIGQVNVLKHSGAQILLDEQIRQDAGGDPVPVTRFFHNKLFFYPQVILSNFGRSLTLDFLFLKGDSGEKVYLVPYHGVLYIWLLPLLLIGIYYSLKNFPALINFVLYGLILASFSGNALSVYGSESQRTLIAAPLFALISAYGLMKAVRKLLRIKIFVPFAFIYLLFAVISISFFIHQYFIHSKVREPWYRNFGAGQLVRKTDGFSSRYSKTYISGDPYIFFWFYEKVDPSFAQVESGLTLENKDALGRNLRAKIGKFYVMTVDCPAAGKMDILYVCRGTRIPPNSRILDRIDFADGQPAWIFITFSHELLAEPPSPIGFFEKYSLLDPGSEVDYLDASQL